MARQNTTTTWRLDRRINLSVVVQLMVLASLIVGSWANLQRQLDLLQRDVTMLLETQEDFQRRLDSLNDRTISHEYRLQRIEKASVENQGRARADGNPCEQTTAVLQGTPRDVGESVHDSVCTRCHQIRQLHLPRWH